MLSRQESTKSGKKLTKGKSASSRLIVPMLKNYKPSDTTMDDLRLMKKHFDGAVFMDFQHNVISHV